MTVEFWAWYYLANPSSQEDEDDEFDIEKVIAELEKNGDFEEVKIGDVSGS